MWKLYYSKNKKNYYYYNTNSKKSYWRCGINMAYTIKRGKWKKFPIKI